MLEDKMCGYKIPDKALKEIFDNIDKRNNFLQRMKPVIIKAVTYGTMILASAATAVSCEEHESCYDSDQCVKCDSSQVCNCSKPEDAPDSECSCYCRNQFDNKYQTTSQALSPDYDLKDDPDLPENADLRE